MLSGRRCAGRRSPNCSTRSTSLPIRAASAWISPVSSRSASPSPISSSCAAPEMPASGFLISCASIAAMPVTERAAERWPRLRSILSAMPCGCIRIRISPSPSCSGAAWTFCSCGGWSAQPTMTLYCATETPLRRACPTTSSTALSAPRNLPSGRPAICRSEVAAEALGRRVGGDDACRRVDHQRRIGDGAPERLEAAGVHAAASIGRRRSPRGPRASAREHRAGSVSVSQPARAAPAAPATPSRYQPRCLRATRSPEVAAVEAEHRLVVLAARAPRAPRRRRAGGGRAAPAPPRSRPSTQGRPRAPRPTITPSAPERASARRAVGGIDDVAVGDHRDAAPPASPARSPPSRRRRRRTGSGCGRAR